MTARGREPWLDDTRLGRLGAVAWLAAFALGVWWIPTRDLLIGVGVLVLVVVGGLLLAYPARVDRVERARIRRRS